MISATIPPAYEQERPGICACPAETSIAMHATIHIRGIEEEYLFDETECDIGAVSDSLEVFLVSFRYIIACNCKSPQDNLVCLLDLRSISELSSGTGNRPGICACPAGTSIAMHTTIQIRGTEEEYLFDETECDIEAVSDFLLRLLMMKKLVRIQTRKHEFLHVHPDQQDVAAATAAVAAAVVVVVAVASPHPQLVDRMAASRRSTTMNTKYLKPTWLLLP
ncbi:hypothetical protein Q3G72_020072 [Acer saccharum]|nr:hypothetical protein Q3G72_020072 [Acer saccharum]